MCDANIITDHISKKHLHLYTKGTGRMALNIIICIWHRSQYSSFYPEIIRSYKSSYLNPHINNFIPSEKNKGPNDSDNIYRQISDV